MLLLCHNLLFQFSFYFSEKNQLASLEYPSVQQQLFDFYDSDIEDAASFIFTIKILIKKIIKKKIKKSKYLENKGRLYHITKLPRSFEEYPA